MWSCPCEIVGSSLTYVPKSHPFSCLSAAVHNCSAWFLEHCKAFGETALLFLFFFLISFIEKKRHAFIVKIILNDYWGFWEISPQQNSSLTEPNSTNKTGNQNPKSQLQTLDPWRSTREPIKSRCVYTTRAGLGPKLCMITT